MFADILETGATVEKKGAEKLDCVELRGNLDTAIIIGETVQIALWLAASDPWPASAVSDCT